MSTYPLSLEGFSNLLNPVTVSRGSSFASLEQIETTTAQQIEEDTGLPPLSDFFSSEFSSRFSLNVSLDPASYAPRFVQQFLLNLQAMHTPSPSVFDAPDQHINVVA